MEVDWNRTVGTNVVALRYISPSECVRRKEDYFLLLFFTSALMKFGLTFCLFDKKLPLVCFVVVEPGPKTTTSCDESFRRTFSLLSEGVFGEILLCVFVVLFSSHFEWEENSWEFIQLRRHSFQVDRFPANCKGGDEIRWSFSPSFANVCGLNEAECLVLIYLFVTVVWVSTPWNRRFSPAFIKQPQWRSCLCPGMLPLFNWQLVVFIAECNRGWQPYYSRHVVLVLANIERCGAWFFWHLAEKKGQKFLLFPAVV